MSPPGTPKARISWRPCYRIIPSRFPPIDLFERIADPADWEALAEIEAMTNDRIRDEIGDISLVPVADRISGPGASVVMAAFTHLGSSSRFADESFGAFYAALSLATAIAETKYHRARFLRATAEAPITVDMRAYAVDLDGRLHDIRGRSDLADIYDPADYAASQGFARRLRGEGSDGIVYDSVRDSGGECAAVFRPPLLANVRQERHLAYVWDGREITEIYEKREFSA